MFLIRQTCTEAENISSAKAYDKGEGHATDHKLRTDDLEVTRDHDQEKGHPTPWDRDKHTKHTHTESPWN